MKRNSHGFFLLLRCKYFATKSHKIGKPIWDFLQEMSEKKINCELAQTLGYHCKIFIFWHIGRYPALLVE